MTKPRYEYEVQVIKRDRNAEKHPSGALLIVGHLGFRFVSDEGRYSKSIIDTVKATMRSITGVKIIEEYL